MSDKLETVDLPVNMGPAHPATHGVFRMLLTIDGERIVDVEPIIGYLHRGVEKLCENKGYRQGVVMMDRMDYVSPFNNELPLVLAAEKLLNIKVPERAQYIRVIMCELNRIASHIFFYGAFGSDVGALTPFLFGFRERERIQQIFEAVSGSRMNHNYLRIGGLGYDVPDHFEKMVRETLPLVARGIDDCDRLLTENEVFRVRTKGVGMISAEDAIDYGLSGPMLRASGVAEDIRRTDPYLVYDRIEFAVPVGENGDTYDRYILRIAEMRESLRIITQALDQMPKEGPYMGSLPKAMRPPPGEVYVRCENPRGEIGIYMVSDGTLRPYRVKVRGPSFCNLMALRHLLRDAYVADAVVIGGSIDIVLGEVDR
jgi:NADH-quinone oxidoreductase subunit D